MARVALLLGLFVVPTVLLALGHHLRSQGPVQRGAFWGGVIGHGAAMLAALVALHYPPVLWRSDTRVFIAFWLLLVGGVVGALLGAARGSGKPRFPERRVQ